MKLSSEDSLRLNVLVSNAEAVRIDESTMTVYGLQGERELKMQLNPTCNGDKYLGYVREALAGAVLDSPGGYPVFLRRWTRMGQIDNEQMDRLLCLGEPEAVMAVVCSPGLTDELARRAWWAAPNAEHARRMLENPQVAGGGMGQVLAQYLLDYLPFETEHRDILESVRLVLQPGLISEEQCQRLWAMGRNKKTFRVGFLCAMPDTLPGAHPGRPEAAWLAELAEMGNGLAAMLARLLGSAGQTFMEVAADALRRPADQDVASVLLNVIGDYLAPIRPAGEPLREVVAIEAWVAEALKEPPAELAALLAELPELEPELAAMLFLALVSEELAIPVFARSDAVGSVMRSRLEPVSAPVLERFAVLRGIS